ncbi:unnamed protein product [Caenorhabditis sp. 36 PRJEB53466]|nr:unnamed protein product [Caenorhabditis sp. 36 PRJEB53466]
MHPEIIVEELEEDEAEDEDEEEKEDVEAEEDDVATPLRPTDTFPFKRRNSPFIQKMSEESLNHLRAINPDLGECSAPSPTPTTCSTLSRHEFTSWRINEDVMGNMMHISEFFPKCQKG